MKLEQISVNKGAFGISGQVALITGASSGLRRACAITLGSAGAKVVVNHLPDSADDSFPG